MSRISRVNHLIYIINLPELISNLTPKRIAVKLRPAAEKKIRSERHPWVFDKSIVKQNKEGVAGDIAVVFDQRKDAFLACGLYDPDSPIRIKLLQFIKPANLNQQWFHERVAEAYQIRSSWLSSRTNAYRLLFGENDGFPGVIVDVYDDVAVLKLYSAIWFPYVAFLLESIISVTSCATVVLRLSRNIKASSNDLGLQDGQVLYGELENENILIQEHGVLFHVNVVKGHKTGFFLDHRENRRIVGEMAQEKNVLDVFSYAGGFSVHALVGGARTVTSVDVSRQALDLATHNGQLNKYSGRHEVICGDAFNVLQELISNDKKFDIVIIDPPAFAKRASEIDRAIQQYIRLAKLGSQLIKKGGTLLLASCSTRVTVDAFFEANQDALRYTNLFLVRRTFHDVDHPIGFKEGAYLKAGYYTNG